MPAVKITGMGCYLPRNKVLSTELDFQLNLPTGSVQKKSGLISRHFASPDETTSYMGAQAALVAVRQANIQLAEIDAIISACGVGEQAIPCTSALIQKQLGMEQSGTACFDVNSTCLSFISALDIASYLVDGERYKRVLIVSSDIASAGLNWQDMETCTIFGDGAAACILEKSDGTNRILSSHHETHSIGSSFCQIEAGGTRLTKNPLSSIEKSLFYMEGKKVFKLASKLLDSLMENLLDKANLSMNDIDWFVPHQASLLAMHHVQKRLNIPPEKFVSIYPYHGNQIAASIPTALCTLVDSKQLHRGQLVLLMGTGAGLAAGGLILEF
ncbi:beta-ketoacyl-ACP synthase III [Legionella parisiensis]|uniref:3-oxoacyl-[acyl-carrier-protein] synthase 3 n=1 Tax=Legionella parisiensis TaxID=45071 RepID=A0A1E5JQI9_9GAMM|nr:beta-ketoacyl-ACP synthase III [Legionella parisiensis]KTD39923.1 3-oxoacyl-ACP synthase [Legionella parisiensis]OEH46643.1 3-oxoacyl-[acyl-carrier-protein] synthase 3 [Legionella parisiensis]STX77533.1 3-oxoacyl-ACP synthase [Legionella parisiensis]